MSIDAPELANGHAPPPPPRNTFRPGVGGSMPLDWGDYMLSKWRAAELSGAKPPKFSDALKDAVHHFMMDGQP